MIDNLEQEVRKQTLELSETNQSLQIEIRDRKQAEETIQQKEAFLNRVIEQSPFAIWISDAQGTLQLANTALKKFLNLTDKQFVGKYNVLKDPLLERQGLNVVLNWIDIIERKKIEAENQALEQQLRQSHKMEAISSKILLNSSGHRFPQAFKSLKILPNITTLCWQMPPRCIR